MKNILGCEDCFLRTRVVSTEAEVRRRLEAFTCDGGLEAKNHIMSLGSSHK